MKLKTFPPVVFAGALLALAACTKDKPTESSEKPKAPNPVAEGSASPSSALSAAPPDSSSVPADPASSVSAKPSAAAASSADAGAKASSKDGPDGGADGGKTATSDTPKSSTSADALPKAAAGSADEVADKLDTIYQPKKTFSAKFSQEFTVKVSGVVKNSTGTLYVERPNKVSFRYDAPNKNRIVSDGTTLKIYVAEDSQMITQPVAKTEYPGALAFLMGHGLRQTFTFGFNDKLKFDPGPVLFGKPREQTPYYKSVSFFVDKALIDSKDPNTIKKVLIIDAQDNKNRFEFSNAAQPDKIDSSEFTFTPPAGTDIKNSP